MKRGNVIQSCSKAVERMGKKSSKYNLFQIFSNFLRSTNNDLERGAFYTNQTLCTSELKAKN